MNDADELAKLADLHARGVLNDEEFAKAKARVLSGQASAAGSHASSSPNVGAVNGLRRSRMDRWLGGVCGGVWISSAVSPSPTVSSRDGPTPKRDSRYRATVAARWSDRFLLKSVVPTVSVWPSMRNR